MLALMPCMRLTMSWASSVILRAGKSIWLNGKQSMAITILSRLQGLSLSWFSLAERLHLSTSTWYSFAQQLSTGSAHSTARQVGCASGGLRAVAPKRVAACATRRALSPGARWIWPMRWCGLGWLVLLPFDWGLQSRMGFLSHERLRFTNDQST